MEQKGNTPFYLHMPFYAPHSPYDYQPEADRKPYENAALGCFPDEPEHRNRNYGQRNLQNNPAAKKGYSALITGMGRNIGRILRRLEERGWHEDTLVVFTADQGWNAGHHGVWGKGRGLGRSR